MLDRAGLARAGSKAPPAIAFVDLTGYTSLTEREGDVSAAEVADRFVELESPSDWATGRSRTLPCRRTGLESSTHLRLRTR